MISAFEAALIEETTASASEQRALALNITAKAVGAVVLARAAAVNAPLAQEIVDATLAGAMGRRVSAWRFNVDARHPTTAEGPAGKIKGST